MESQEKNAERDKRDKTGSDKKTSILQQRSDISSQTSDYQTFEQAQCPADVSIKDISVKENHGITSKLGHRFTSAERPNHVRQQTITCVNDMKSLDKTKNASSVPDAKCKKVGQYLLGETIGEGSYGKVRLATHLISKQQVAIKVVTKKMLVVNEAARRNFRREALLLHHVTHPNIVKLYEAMETSNSYYLVFELATGGNILALLSQRGSLTEEESRHYMRQAVSAVDHLHRSGIVHRDLKLENFLLDDKNDIKLVDFGLGSVCHNSDHQLSTQCGSPVYAAPELFAGRKYGQLVDVWSLGVCLFAMLTGRLPFLPNDENSLPQLYSIIIKGCVMPGYLSQSCQNLLGRMLELQETRRITMEEIVTHHWLLFPTGHPIKRVPRVPKKLNENIINVSIVKYMCTMYRFSENDVITSVLERKLSAAAATYNILKDNIETGKVSISFPRERSHGDRMTSPRKTSGTFPAIASNSSSTYSEGPLTAKNLGDSVTSKSHIISDSYSKRGELASDKPTANSSYKSCILVLKRSRQYGLPSRSSGIHHDNLDYFLVGKSPRSKDIPDTRHSLNNLHSPALPDISMPSTFPPISSSGGSPCVGQKHYLSDSQGQRHYIHRNQAQMVELDVRGVSPCVYDRSSPFYQSGVAAYIYSNNSGHASSFSINSLLPNRTPPPPPPNSSFGSYSNQSKSPPGLWNQDQHPAVPGSKQDSHMNTKGYIRHVNGHVSSNDPNRFLRDPARPSLATLRDPFGRDTWIKSKIAKSRQQDWKPPRLRSRRCAQEESLHLQTSVRDTRRPSDDDERQAKDGVTIGDCDVCSAQSSSGIEMQEHFDSVQNRGPSSAESYDSHYNGRPEQGHTESQPDSISSNPDRVNDDPDTSPATPPTTEASSYFTTPRNSPSQNNTMSEFYVHNDSGKASPTWSRQDTDSPLEREDFMTPVTRVTITTIGRH